VFCSRPLVQPGNALQSIRFVYRADRYLPAGTNVFTPTAKVHKCQAADCCDKQSLNRGANICGFSVL